MEHLWVVDDVVVDAKPVHESSRFPRQTRQEITWKLIVLGVETLKEKALMNHLDPHRHENLPGMPLNGNPSADLKQA